MVRVVLFYGNCVQRFRLCCRLSCRLMHWLATQQGQCLVGWCTGVFVYWLASLKTYVHV